MVMTDVNFAVHFLNSFVLRLFALLASLRPGQLTLLGLDRQQNKQEQIKILCDTKNEVVPSRVGQAMESVSFLIIVFAVSKAESEREKTGCTLSCRSIFVF